MPVVSAASARDPLYRGYRFPADIISHAVWLYYRFHLSNRDIEELLAERGVQVSPRWCWYRVRGTTADTTSGPSCREPRTCSTIWAGAASRPAAGSTQVAGTP